MDRSNHYEAAFEAYLRDRRLGYIAIDEARRTRLDDEPVKSLDFVVYGAGGSRLLVDIKGRRFPGGTPRRPNRCWQNWVPRADLDALHRWRDRFGPDYQALLVFVYHILPGIELRPGTADEWCWRGRRYLLRAIPLDDYRLVARPRSQRWDTVHLPTSLFRQIVRPFRDFTHPEFAQSSLS